MRKPAAFLAATLLLSGCTSPQAVAPSQCPAVVPRELPSGAPIGEARIEVTEGGIVRTSWGTGKDRVTIFSAFSRFSPDPGLTLPPDAFDVTVRGDPASVIVIGGDGPDPVVALSWNDGTCAWTVHLGSGNRREDAVDYAGRY
jgi:hypothetical protein